MKSKVTISIVVIATCMYVIYREKQLMKYEQLDRGEQY